MADTVSEDLAEAVDDLEDRVEDVEDAATEPLTSREHFELGASFAAMRADIQQLQQEVARLAELPLEAVSPLEARLTTLEGRLEHGASETAEGASEAAEDVSEAVEIPESVVVPKRRHWYHDMPKWI